MAIQDTGGNTEQIRFWNEVAAPKWIRFRRQIDDLIRPLGMETMQRTGIAEHERALDVGCGCGETTLEIARQVGPAGAVVGVDISAPMLEEARRDAVARGITNVSYENADAQTHAFPSEAFDLLFSRFGVMFFMNPTAAFSNLRTALRANARLAFACWQSIAENPWIGVPMMAAAAHVALPPPTAPDAPGPFAFADRDGVRRILESAGFTRVEIEERRGMLRIGGGTVEEAAEFLIQLGPTASALRDADPALLSRVRDAVRTALEPFATADGVRMSSAAWIVTARNG